MTDTYRITLTAQRDSIRWYVWKGITEQYRPIAEGSAPTWAAATYQAGQVVADVTR